MNVLSIFTKLQITLVGMLVLVLSHFNEMKRE